MRRPLTRAVTVNGRRYPYRLWLPPGYHPARRWPVILFLHGSGERGRDGIRQTQVGLGPALDRHPERYPALVVLPQAPEDTAWVGDPAAAALAALDATLRKFAGDPARVALTGNSLGGNGVWHLASRHPRRFAALAPICGWVSALRGVPEVVPPEVVPPEGVPPDDDAPAPGSASDLATPFTRVARRVGRTPVWLVHGDADPVIPVEESRRMAAALETAGGVVRYTEIPGGGHGAWTPAYGSPELAAWLCGGWEGDGGDRTSEGGGPASEGRGPASEGGGPAMGSG